MSKLPIGIQDFETIRNDGKTYIDKTEYLAPLLLGGRQYVFFARPRRFGKSMTLSTLKAALEGKQHLFEGLWLHDHYHFEPKPVMHLLMNRVEAKTEPIADGIIKQLNLIAQQYGVECDTAGVGSAMQSLVRALHAKTGKPVNLLIDEYDKLLVDYIDEPEVLANHIKVLRGLYGTLKGLEQYLGFVMLTGVSKFGKLNLFSDLNNIEDISSDEQYALLCGYTRAEIEVSFADEIAAVQRKLKLSTEEFWQQTQDWYNGFSWDGVHKLYCPYSFLLFLKNQDYKSFWYEYASPKLVLDAMKRQGINPRDVQQTIVDNGTISVADITNLEFYSLMFQVGNLTIKHIERSSDGTDYTLGFPNKEVRMGFNYDALKFFNEDPLVSFNVLTRNLRTALLKDNITTIVEDINAVLAGLPYSIIVKQEAYFHSLMYMIFSAIGWEVHNEVQTNRGRIDMVVKYQDYKSFERFWLLEFKLDESADVALTQIEAKGYAEQFAGKAVTKVGVSFNSKERRLAEWKVG